MAETDDLITTRVKVDPNLRLEHVVGQPMAVKCLRDLARRIKWPEVYATWGVSKPKAIALVGPPGTGKTLSLRALSNEIECPLMEIRYEDFATHLYDEAIKRLSTFKDRVDEIAKEHGHVLVFIDEADVFFQSRFGDNVHSSDEKKTNFFLRWIDGDLEGSDGFTLVASSNAWETVDPAMRRPGRFTKIEFKALSVEDVLEAIRVHVSLFEMKVKRKMFKSFDPSVLRPHLSEMTGADVKEILERLLLDKANKHLDLLLNDEKVVPELIDETEMIETIKGYLLDNKSSKRGVGF